MVKDICTYFSMTNFVSKEKKKIYTICDYFFIEYQFHFFLQVGVVSQLNNTVQQQLPPIVIATTAENIANYECPPSASSIKSLNSATLFDE